jgi:hypothetical protein
MTRDDQPHSPVAHLQAKFLRLKLASKNSVT